MKKKKSPKRICPKCHSDNLARVLYGYIAGVDDELSRELREGKVVLGGCCISGERWECNVCHHRF